MNGESVSEVLWVITYPIDGVLTCGGSGSSKWKIALESSCILFKCVLLLIANYLNVTAFILVQVLLLFELRVLHVFLASRASAHPVRFVFLNRS